MNWAITYYSESIQGDILALPAGLLARYLRYADRMEGGLWAGSGYASHAGNGRRAVRIAAKSYRGGIARVLYCTMIGKRIIILHLFTKKTKKTPPKELGIARRRIKEVKDADT